MIQHARKIRQTFKRLNYAMLNSKFLQKSACSYGSILTQNALVLKWSRFKLDSLFEVFKNTSHLAFVSATKTATFDFQMFSVFTDQIFYGLIRSSTMNVSIQNILFSAVSDTFLCNLVVNRLINVI